MFIPAVGMWISGSFRRGFQCFETLDIGLRGPITITPSARFCYMLGSDRRQSVEQGSDVRIALLVVYSLLYGVLSRCS